jgi:glycosyltransferase involved in cell wall biosynthesis
MYLPGGKLSCDFRMGLLDYLCGMLILLDCRPLQYAGYQVDNERSLLILSTAALLSAEQAVKWLYLVDHTYRPGDLPGLPDVAGTGMGGPILITRRAFPGWTGWRIWYDGQIPRLAKKYRADLVMTTAGIATSSMRIPQCVWMPERANPEEEAKKSPSLYRARLAESLFRAAAVFCFSEKDKAFLAGRTPGPGNDKIIVLSPVADAASIPLSPEEKEKAKADYAGGKEYFLAAIPGAGQKESAGQKDLINLLKAFSLFKKRQRSNMQLILIGKRQGPDRQGRSFSGPEGELAEKLATYKYREEVHWFEGRPEDQARITAAAYAVVFPFGGGALGMALLSAWKAEVPVIVPSAGSLPEIAGEAALPGSPDNPTQLATQLMLLYKDEALRRDLIEKGKTRLRSFSGERPADAVWRGIRMATDIIN